MKLFLILLIGLSVQGEACVRFFNFLSSFERNADIDINQMRSWNQRNIYFSDSTKESLPFEQQSADTLEFNGQRSDTPLNGLIYSIVPIDGVWLSSRGEPDIQGDPRYPIMVLGQNSAEFFGFRIYGNRMDIPSAENLIDRINILQGHLPEFFPVGLYLDSSTVPLATRDYVERYAYEGFLPVARQGRLYVHDAIYHSYAPQLIPDWFHQITRERMKAMIEFDDFVKTYYPQHYNEEFFRKMYENLSTDLDIYMGRLTAAYETNSQNDSLEFFLRNSFLTPYEGGLARAHVLLPLRNFLDRLSPAFGLSHRNRITAHFFEMRDLAGIEETPEVVVTERLKDEFVNQVLARISRLRNISSYLENETAQRFHLSE